MLRKFLILLFFIASIARADVLCNRVDNDSELDALYSTAQNINYRSECASKVSSLLAVFDENANLSLGNRACNGVKTQDEAIARFECIRDIRVEPGHENDYFGYEGVSSKTTGVSACRRVLSKEHTKNLKDCVVTVDNMDTITPVMAFVACDGMRTVAQKDAIVRCISEIDDIDGHTPSHAIKTCSGVRDENDADLAISCHRDSELRGAQKRSANCAGIVLRSR